jgi:hypothetical protein
MLQADERRHPVPHFVRDSICRSGVRAEAAEAAGRVIELLADLE